VAWVPLPAPGAPNRISLIVVLGGSNPVLAGYLFARSQRIARTQRQLFLRNGV
jgi:hypothetical protein